MGINSYEPTDIEATNAAEVLRWLVFDPLVDDESLAELMSPLEPLAIRRNGSHATCDYVGKPIDITQFRQKETAWLPTWHNDNDAHLESEREARFHQYYRSLNLDELPAADIRLDRDQFLFDKKLCTSFATIKTKGKRYIESQK